MKYENNKQTTKSSRVISPTKIVDEENDYNDDTIPTITLNLNNSLEIGESFVNIFDLVESTSTRKAQLSTSSNNLRVYLIETEQPTNLTTPPGIIRSGLISDYFALNSLSGELILRNTLLEPRVSQVFKIIQGTSVELINIRIDVDEKFFLWSSRSEDDEDDDENETEVTIELTLRYMLLKYKPTIRLAKIFNFDPTADYYIELTSLNKSTTTNGQLVLSNNIQIVKKIYSLIQIDAEYIVLDSDKFLERNLVRFDFTVLKLSRWSSSENVLERIETRINYKLIVTFDDNFDVMAEYMGYTQHVEVEEHVDAETTRVGQVLFDLNRVLLNGLAFNHLVFELSETSGGELPFGVDLLTGNLVLSHPLSTMTASSNYEFEMALTDKFSVKFTIHVVRRRVGSSTRLKSNMARLVNTRVQGLSEVVKFRVGEKCQNNHFIGKFKIFIFRIN